MMLYCVIICYIRFFFVSLCYFLIYMLMEPFERNKKVDYLLDIAVALVLNDLKDQCHLHPDARRLWSAFDTSDGGRVYLEYRRE